MHRLKFVIFLVPVALLVLSCSGGGGSSPPVTSEHLGQIGSPVAITPLADAKAGKCPEQPSIYEDRSDPEKIALAKVCAMALTEPLTVTSTQVLQNDGDFATIRIIVMRRPERESPTKEQYADIELKRGSAGWALDQYSVEFKDTEAQRLSNEATATANAQTTAVAVERDRQEALSLIEVDLPQQSDLLFHNSQVTLPIRVHNRYSKDHLVRFRSKFRFPDGKIYSFEEEDLWVQANSTLDETLNIYISVFWDEIIDSNTGEEIADLNISLTEWQIIVEGLEGEIHKVN